MRSMRGPLAVLGAVGLIGAGLALTGCGDEQAVAEAAEPVVAGGADPAAAAEELGDCEQVDEECCEAAEVSDQAVPEGCPDCGEVDCCCDKDRKAAAAATPADVPAEMSEAYAEALEECGGCTHCAHAKLGIELGGAHGGARGEAAGDGGCPHAKDGAGGAHHGGDGGCPHGKAKASPAADVPVQG